MQRLEIDGQKRIGKIRLGLDGFCFGHWIAAEIKRAQHVGKTWIAASAIDQDLLARQHRRQHRQIDRQLGARQNVCAVIFTAHLFLAFLLMKLEEELAFAGIEEAVERIQAVAVAIDGDVVGIDPEGIAQQFAQQGLGRTVVQSGKPADFGGPARGMDHVEIPEMGSGEALFG